MEVREADEGVALPRKVIPWWKLSIYVAA